MKDKLNIWHAFHLLPFIICLCAWLIVVFWCHVNQLKTIYSYFFFRILKIFYWSRKVKFVLFIWPGAVGSCCAVSGTRSRSSSVSGQGHWMELTPGGIFLIVGETRAPWREPTMTWGRTCKCHTLRPSPPRNWIQDLFAVTQQWEPLHHRGAKNM